ncbi:MAG: carboxypeptidase-like regulatory domain-containing protein [Terriglobales bacterium]
MAIATLMVASAALVSAETLAGTVTNATNGKPSAGDDVVLITLSQGMQESGRAKTDAQGRFRFDITDSGGPHLVRVNHQGVNYFPAGGPIRPGTTATEIKVYDSAKKLDGIAESLRVVRVQADQTNLQVIELISVKNDSNPPRALMADRTWEIYLPEGAQVDQSAAQGPGGMPVNTAPVPDDKQKGRYYFVFPLRPGETRFQVAYHLPYSGEATLKPRITGKLEHFAIMLPKSMEFGAKSSGVFSPVQDESGQNTLEVATNVTADKDLSFRVSGKGTIADSQGEQQEAQSGGGMPGGTATRQGPGGGLGTPEGTPDPLHKYRWAILGVTLALLAAGGGWVVSRPSGAPQRSKASAPPLAEDHLPGGSNLLLQAMKEELFQLELDRQQGKVSEAEYQKSKAALDHTLKRALARDASGSKRQASVG